MQLQFSQHIVLFQKKLLASDECYSSFCSKLKHAGSTLGNQTSTSKVSLFYLKVTTSFNGITGMSAVISYP